MGQYGANASTVNKLPDSAFTCRSNCFWNHLNPGVLRGIKLELTKGRHPPSRSGTPTHTLTCRWSVIDAFFLSECGCNTTGFMQLTRRSKWKIINARTLAPLFRFGLLHTSAAADVSSVCVVYMVCERCTRDVPLLSRNVRTRTVSVPMCFLLFVVNQTYSCYYCIYSWKSNYMHCLNVDAYNILYIYQKQLDLSSGCAFPGMK